MKRLLAGTLKPPTRDAGIELPFGRLEHVSQGLSCFGWNDEEAAKVQLRCTDEAGGTNGLLDRS